MVARGRTASTAGATASRSSSSSTGSSSSSTSSGSSSASTSSSSKGSTSSGAGAARSSRSSVSVSSPTASKTVTTTKTTTPSTTTAPAKITTTTTATPKTAISVSTDLARAITESQAKYPEAWEKATGTTNIQQQFEQDIGMQIPNVPESGPADTIPNINDWQSMNQEERAFRASLYSSETGGSPETFFEMIGRSAPAQQQQLQYGVL